MPLTNSKLSLQTWPLRDWRVLHYTILVHLIWFTWCLLASLPQCIEICMFPSLFATLLLYLDCLFFRVCFYVLFSWILPAVLDFLPSDVGFVYLVGLGRILTLIFTFRHCVCCVLNKRITDQLCCQCLHLGLHTVFLVFQLWKHDSPKWRKLL